MSLAGSVGGTSSPGFTGGGPVSGGSAVPGSSSPGSGPLIQGSNGQDGSGTTSPLPGRLNTVNLVALVPTIPSPLGVANASTPSPLGVANASTPSPLGVANASTFPSPIAAQLDSALGGSNNPSTNPTTPASLLAPTPLAVTPSLPVIQVSQTVLGNSSASGTGSDPSSGLPVQSVPEPEVLALFTFLAFASVIKTAVRRLRSLNGRARFWEG
jgi:hypothetical protein